MQIKDEQQKAARDIVDLIASAIGKNREVHSATAIATASRLSGAFLFNSFGFQVNNATPGTAMLSTEANEQGPELINIIGGVLGNLGITLDAKQLESAKIETAELDFLKSLKITQKEAETIRIKYDLNFKEMAITCAMSTGFIIEQCKNDISVASGFNIAVYGLIEGAKTVPPKSDQATID